MNNFQTRYQKLNPEQKMAVDTIEGPVLVVAGPGSGKTELLSLRTANILEKTQMNPSNILLLTFTENGAKNMRERLVGMIGEAGYRVAIYTFHAFASDVINKYPEYFFDGASFRPATEIEKVSIIENILKTLPRDNPLSSLHPEKGFVYIHDIIATISALKKGNLSGIEFKNKIEEYKKEGEEINKKVGKHFLSIAGRSKYEMLRNAFLEIYNELKNLTKKENATAKFLLNTLSLEIKQAEEVGKGNNLTKWKNDYFTKGEEGNFILKNCKEEKIEKWIAFSDVYDKYNLKMYIEGLYDFDDMIFKVGRELENNQTLRAELAEKYQYIMIDEFQDTSDAQFNLIKNLTNESVNEGNPNILAVGDDDQAIFKFQGAELDNITKYIEIFPKVKFITLNKNYRSTQNILNEARRIITKIDDRLETRFSQIDKNIKAENKELIPGDIIEKSFDNPYSEMDFIAKEIKSILEKGINPKEISVISKSHINLKEIANVLKEYNIPYSYEKEENVFDKEPIRELITIVDFVSSSLDNLKEVLLPEILSFKFWDLERIEIWKIAEKVKVGEIEIDEFGDKIYKRLSWLSVMLKSENEKIKSIANFLIELIADSQSLPLLHLLDKIIGTKEWEIDNQIDDEQIEKIEKKENHFISPFRNYYFGKDNFDHNKPVYLDFLFALRTFIGALREYRSGNILYAKDLEEFINIYENNKNLTLSTISPFATSEEAIILQTAHKSKGLEYEYVFILNSDEDEWNGKKRDNKIGMPISMPLLPTKDDISDRVRLYYVAMTRAKHTLYITHNKEKFSKLLKDKEENTKEKNDLNKNILNSLYIKERKDLMENEKVLLKRLLENYKMPVTHIINFLNIGKIGPEKFIEQNLLRFPQALSPSSVYGSAMHKAIENYFKYKKKYDENPPFEKVVGYFKNALNIGTLNKIDFDKYYESGIKNLEIYIKYLEEKEYKPKTEVEVDFKNQGVSIDSTELTGKIDKIEIEGNKIKVTDLKTGKSFKDWTNGDNPYDKIKLHFFKYQLAFYKILLKNSRNYNEFDFDSGIIEFVEADNKNRINVLSLENNKEFEEIVERVKALTKVIYKKIMDLDFPDTSRYKINEKTGEEKSEISLKDIERFEEDLLNGNI